MIYNCAVVQSLFIAIPAYQGTCVIETAVSLAAVAGIIGKSPIPFEVCYRAGNCYIDHARNQLVADFKASGKSDMLMIDADVGFVPEAVLKICLATKPIVAALYPKKTVDEEWPVEFFPGIRVADEEGLVEAAMVPTGLLRINRAVFDELDKPEFGFKRYRDTSGDRDLVAYFETDIRDRYYGEDVDFCRKWRAFGGRLHVLPEVMLTHTGMKTWNGNLGEAMKAGRI